MLIRSKVGRAAEAIESVENVSKTAKVAKTIGKGAGQSSRIETDEISMAALQQLINASKAGKLPYNVINTAKLRNQLRKITQRSTGEYSYDLVSRIERQKEYISIRNVNSSRSNNGEVSTSIAGSRKNGNVSNKHSAVKIERKEQIDRKETEELKN